jgi:hypothetical protein
LLLIEFCTHYDREKVTRQVHIKRWSGYKLNQGVENGEEEGHQAC